MIQKPKIKVLFIPLAEPNSMQLTNKNCRQELTKIFLRRTFGEIAYTLNQNSHEIEIWNTKDMDFQDNVLPFASRHKDIVIVARFLNQQHKCQIKVKDCVGESYENMRENIYEEGQKFQKRKQIWHNQQQKNLQQYADIKIPKQRNPNKPDPHQKNKKNSDIIQSHITHSSFQREVITDEQLQFRKWQHFRQERQKMNFYTKTIHLNNHIYTCQEIIQKLRKYNKDSTIILVYIDATNINMPKLLQQQQLNPQNCMNISEYFDKSSISLVPINIDIKTENNKQVNTNMTRESFTYKEQKQYACVVYYVKESAFHSNSKIMQTGERGADDRTLIEKVLDYFIYEISRISRYTFDTSNSSSIVKKLNHKPRKQQKKQENFKIQKIPKRSKSFSLLSYLGIECCMPKPRKTNSNPINKTQNYTKKE